jgi:hypothetical protein
MAEYREPHPCPDCGNAAPRVLLTPPGFAAMDAALRLARATNERSAHLPRESSRVGGHGAGRSSSAAPSTSSRVPSLQGRRPWMIGH